MTSKYGRNRENYQPRDEYYTPKWIFENMGLIFDLDPAHPNHKTDVPCKEYYTKEQNGIELNWFGNVWLNPPFSESKIWVQKFINHRQGIALLPFAKSAWFTGLWNDVDAVMPLPYNTKFTFNGKTNGSIFFLTGLFAYGKGNVEAISKIGKVRL